MATYQRVDYIQTNGNQYFNPNITPTKYTGIFGTLELSDAVSWAYVAGEDVDDYGARNGYTPFPTLDNDSTIVYIEPNRWTATGLDNSKITFSFNCENITHSGDTEPKYSKFRKNFFSTGLSGELEIRKNEILTPPLSGMNLYILGHKHTVVQDGVSNIQAVSAGSKLYSFSIYENEVRTHYYIPVLAAGEACLYDIVTKTLLFHEGGGSLAYGSVVGTIETNYTGELEYIETIDFPNLVSLITADVNTTLFDAPQFIIDCSFENSSLANTNSWNLFNSETYYANIVADFPNNKYVASLLDVAIAPNIGRHHITHNRQMVYTGQQGTTSWYYVDHTRTCEIDNNTPISSTVSLQLSRTKYTEYQTTSIGTLTIYGFPGKIYSIQMKKNDTLVLDLVPYQTINGYGVYDKVSNRMFLRNSMYGEFVGPALIRSNSFKPDDRFNSMRTGFTLGVANGSSNDRFSIMR